MIFILAIFIFLSLFFLGMSVSHFIRFDEKEAARRIERRLHEETRDKSPGIRLEKKERLSDIGFLDRLLKTVRKTACLQNWIRQAGLTFSAGVFLLVTLLVGASLFLAAWLLKTNIFISAGLGIFLMTLPGFYIAFRRASRRKKFQESFPDAVARMASALRAGYSLQMAFEAVAEDAGTLLAREFRHVLSEVAVGQGFEEAMKNMSNRMDTPELRLFVASVILQKESGGNLAQLLDNLEATIRERFDLQRELDAATSQARLSGLVLGLLPVFVGFFVFLIHRDYILFLFQDDLGKKLLWLSIAGQTAGLLSIRKIIHIEM